MLYVCIMEKTCIICGETKPYSEFTKCKSCNNGVRGECSKCFSKKSLDSYYKHREDRNQRRRESYTGTTEEIRIRQKEWANNNPEKMKIYQERKYKKHRDKIIQNAMKWNRMKLDTDILFKLKALLRSRLYAFLKNKGFKKPSSTTEIVGCSQEFLREHLEQKFVEGMSWENQGEWHIDHIVPLSTAETEEDVYKLCHYTNLQPLWAKDNLIKSDKIN